MYKGMIDIKNLISIIIAMILFGILMTGVYYSIILTHEFDKKDTKDKALGVVISILTILLSLAYFYYYVLPGFKRSVIVSDY